MKQTLPLLSISAILLSHSALAAPMDTLTCQYTKDGNGIEFHAPQTYPLAIQKLYKEHTASGVVPIQDTDLQVVFDFGFYPPGPSDIPGHTNPGGIQLKTRLQRVKDGQIQILAISEDDHTQKYPADAGGEVTLWDVSVVSSALNAAHFDPSASNLALTKTLWTTPGTQIRFSCDGNWQ